MPLTRRNYLLGTASLAFLASIRTSQAQTGGGANELRDVFAIPNYRVPSPNLQFLKNAQEQRIAAPRDTSTHFSWIVSRDSRYG